MNPSANARISELAARESKLREGNAAKALRRVARKALTWPVEASFVAESGSLTTLDGVGPFIAQLILGWLDDGDDPLEPPPARSGFLTYTQVLDVLRDRPMQLRGDLQTHTTWSDGSVSLEELAAAAIEMGEWYVAVTDHSKGLKIAGGMDEQELARQIIAIDEVNEATGRQVLLRSLEMNLSPTGEGDMDPSSLSHLDLVLGSFHSKLRLTDDQTDRYIAALRDPHIHVLAHPKGRIFNFRTGLAADWPRVFAEAAILGKAVEIDAFPDRQDMSVELASLAAREGCYVSIGSDAHHPGQMTYVSFGSAIALLAGVEPEHILNLMSLEDLKAWAQTTSERASLPTAG